MGIEQLTFIKLSEPQKITKVPYSVVDENVYDIDSDFKDKVQVVIERLQYFCPPEGYYFADSYGKDSSVCRDLLIRAKVKYDGHYHRTGIDPPEAIRFGRKYHPEVINQRTQDKTIWDFIPINGFPTRTIRWCCREFKENGGFGRLVVTGIRWDESGQRANRQMVEVCNKSNMGGKRFLNPIIDWTDEDVWNYIKFYKLPICELYSQGYKRIGCILCPMKLPEMDLERYPGFVKLWRLAFNRLYDARKLQGNDSISRWQSGDEMFEWWLTRKGDEKETEQCFMFE